MIEGRQNAKRSSLDKSLASIAPVRGRRLVRADCPMKNQSRELTVPDCYRESRILIVLKRDLLRKHDVAPGETSRRSKAPGGHLRATLIEFVNVHDSVIAD